MNDPYSDYTVKDYIMDLSNDLAKAMFFLILCGMVMFGLYLVSNYKLGVELVAVTAEGEEFVAGSGDTCVDAFAHPVYPPHFVKLRCEHALIKK